MLSCHSSAELRIRDDTAAGMQVGATIAQQDGANDDTEIRAPSEVEVTERSGIDTSPHGLQLIEDSHRGDLGGTRHRPGWKRRAHQIEYIAFVAKPTANRRHHLVDGRVAFDRHELRDFHAADLANATEIVANQIDDHEIFSSVLGGSFQCGPIREIRRLVAAAGAGALDRSALDPPISVDPEKTLWRAADDRHLGKFEVARKGRGVQLAQFPIERPRVGRTIALFAVGEAHLVGLARLDLLFGGIDRFCIGVRIEERERSRRALHRSGACRWRRDIDLRADFGDRSTRASSCRVEFVRKTQSARVQPAISRIVCEKPIDEEQVEIR